MNEEHEIKRLLREIMGRVATLQKITKGSHDHRLVGDIRMLRIWAERLGTNFGKQTPFEQPCVRKQTKLKSISLG